MGSLTKCAAEKASPGLSVAGMCLLEGKYDSSIVGAEKRGRCSCRAAAAARLRGDGER